MVLKNSYFATGVDMLEKHIVPFKIEAIQLYMSILLDLAQGRSDVKGSEENRRGYFTLMNGTNGVINFTIPFGEIPNEKEEKYFYLSQEKATRLFSYLNNHTTSFQSRNTEVDKYGGSIFVNYHTNLSIFSFSGMPELIDEAMMLVLAKKLAKDNGLHIIQKIEAYERNPYWKSLYTDFYNHGIIRVT